MEFIISNGAAGCVITTDKGVTHPSPSVRLSEYVPGANKNKSCVVSPFDHKYVKFGIPPTGVTFIDPEFSPKQATLLWVSFMTT